ncbi:helix-turn-helix domain-containing protein [Roseibacillus persicicus]|uniref:helix-turn-helix domain-containing protein n=1 Tax=Roseibacillus persicicus TaxID=454148 RepID=UPI00398A902C
MLIKTPSELGHFVRKKRLEKGWSQQTLADKSEVSRVWLGELERGKDTLALNLVLRTIRTLNIAIDLKDLPPDPLEDLLKNQ